MAVRGPVQKRSTGLKYGACHLNMVVGKVEEELLDAEEGVYFGEDLELGHLAYEPTDLQLGFNVDLIFLPDMPSEILKSLENINSSCFQGCIKCTLAAPNGGRHIFAEGQG